MNHVEELCWWLKGKFITSPQSVEQERAMIAFERTRRDLENGYIFDWNQSATTTTMSASAAPSSLLNSALSLLGGGSSAATDAASKPCQVLVRLHIPSNAGAASSSTTSNSLGDRAGKIFNAALGAEDENVTCLTWTALLLEHNRPNPIHRVALHKVQTVRVSEISASTKGGSGPAVVTLSDHAGNILFQGSALEARKWADEIQEARRVLAAQLEEESNNSGHYHEQKLQRIEARKLEREKLREQFEMKPMMLA